MPDADSTVPAAWSLPTLDDVEITYTTTDRRARKRHPGDHDMRFVQFIEGQITGFAYLGRREEAVVPLGTVELALIDMWEVEEEGERLSDVLDTHSSEWLDYLELADAAANDDKAHAFTHHLLIADRLVLVPEARRHGLGLHVLARAILTWSFSGTLVVLTAGSTLEREEEVDDAQRVAGNEALARYWQQLGVKRTEGDRDLGPLLYGYTEDRKFEDTLKRYCAWQSPVQAQEIPE